MAAGQVELQHQDDSGTVRPISPQFPLDVKPAPLMSGQAFIGFIGQVEDKAVEAGLFRWAGGKVSTSAVSPNASLTITNPASSPRDLVVTRYQV